MVSCRTEQRDFSNTNEDAEGPPRSCLLKNSYLFTTQARNSSPWSSAKGEGAHSA